VLAPPRRSARVRAAVSGTVVLVLIGFGAAVVASIVTPGGERVSGEAVAVDGGPGAYTGVDRASGAGEPGDGVGGGAGTTAPTAIVHITGAVAHPGVVEVSVGARVVDVIARAGGTTEGADLAAINLARPVVDGEQIHVPREGESPPVPHGSAGAASSGPGGAVININTAGSAELETLPGVGPALAGRIIAWRDQNGPFRAVDELLAVSGIGEKTLSGFRDRVGT
jgi:competence protein ComEA